MGQAVLAQLGITGGDVLAQLRAKPWVDILNAAGLAGYYANLTVDGWVLPDMVSNIFQSGKQAAVPVIVGANSAETLLYGPNTILASSMQNVGKKAYIYVFSFLPANWRGAPGVMGVPHALELQYYYGRLESLPLYAVQFNWTYAAGIGRDPACTPNPGPSLDPTNPNRYALLDEEAVYTAEAFQTIVARFCKTGAPSVRGLIKWPAYDPANPQYFDLGVELQILPWSPDAFNCN